MSKVRGVELQGSTGQYTILNVSCIAIHSDKKSIKTQRRLHVHHGMYRVYPQKLHSCISLVRVSKLVFDQVFTNIHSIGLALALEAANERLSAQGAARIFFDW